MCVCMPDLASDFGTERHVAQEVHGIAPAALVRHWGRLQIIFDDTRCLPDLVVAPMTQHTKPKHLKP